MILIMLLTLLEILKLDFLTFLSYIINHPIILHHMDLNHKIKFGVKFY